VHTGGELSKFGIPRSDLEAARDAVENAGARVVGLHAHAGSGILDPASWAEVGASLMAARDLFPDVAVVDVGGGLGVPEKPGQGTLDLRAVDDSLRMLKAAHPGVKVFSLPSVDHPQWGRHIELGVKGEPANADAAYLSLREGLKAFTLEYGPELVR
jgi:diaminopimelate decarboxylase/aspartate kinase